MLSLVSAVIVNAAILNIHYIIIYSVVFVLKGCLHCCMRNHGKLTRGVWVHVTYQLAHRLKYARIESMEISTVG